MSLERMRAEGWPWYCIVGYYIVSAADYFEAHLPHVAIAFLVSSFVLIVSLLVSQ